MITDRHGAIRLINGQTEQLFGWTQTELLGQPVDMLMPQPDLQDHVTVLEACAADAVTPIKYTPASRLISGVSRVLKKIG